MKTHLPPVTQAPAQPLAASAVPPPETTLPRAAFEQALRRAVRGGPGADEPLPAEAAAAPPPLKPAPEVPVQAPHAATAPCAVTTHLRALQLPDTRAPAGRWQLQLPTTGIDAPQLHVQRNPDGGLHLVLSTAPGQQRSTPLAALRERLQALGHSVETRIHRDPPEEPP